MDSLGLITAIIMLVGPLLIVLNLYWNNHKIEKEHKRKLKELYGARRNFPYH